MPLNQSNYNQQYRQSPKGKAAREKYLESSKGKATTKERNQRYRLSHLEERKAYIRRWRKEHPDLCRASWKRQYERNKDTKLQKSRAVWRNRKLQVLAAYGPSGKVACSWPGCEVTDSDMLSIDHINNDGRPERDTHGLSGFYLRLVRNNFPSGYQTLCMNHQIKKELLRKREQRASI